MGVKMLVIGSFLVFDLSFYHFDLSFCVLFQFLRFFLISVFAILLKKSLLCYKFVYRTLFICFVVTKLWHVTKLWQFFWVFRSFSDLASKPLGILTWSMKDKSWQWVWSTMSQNFIKIHALGAELQRFECHRQTYFFPENASGCVRFFGPSVQTVRNLDMVHEWQKLAMGLVYLGPKFR